MPVSITWTLRQLIEMRIAAIELLRMMNRGANLRRYHYDIWQYWVATHGMPQPDDWNQVQDYRDFVMEYRERLFRAIDWHAFRGRFGPSNHLARIRRIRQISESVDRDIADLHRSGIDPNSPASLNNAASYYIPTRARPLSI